MPDTIDDIRRNAPVVDGIELVKILKPRKPLHPDEKVEIFLPITPQSDYQPADAYKDAVKRISKDGVDDNFLLFSSVRKLSEKYNSLVAADLKAYTHAGLTDQMTGDQVKNTVLANISGNKGALETIVRNFDNAWAEPDTPGFVTPGIAHEAYEDATHTLPDANNDLMKNALTLQKFVAGNGSIRDQKNLIEGKQFYVMRYKEVEQDGQRGLTVDYVEVWQKKK
jgi:hypothetical protein